MREEIRMNVTEWFETSNPMLGDISPIEMIRNGRGSKLCRWIETAMEDCPASECDGEECECITQTKDGVLWHDNPKEPNESLERKLHELFFSEFGWDCTEIDKDVKTVAQIAKEHYQEHPDEIDCCTMESHMKIYDEDFMDGMVKLSDVLRVFDKAFNQLTYTRVKEWSVVAQINYIRKAIEQLGEKK